MKRLVIPAFVILVLAAAAIVLRSSPSIDIAAGAAAMPSLHELHATVGVSRLPVQDIEDQSLVYPSPARP